MSPTPKRLAIERIQRKATGLAMAAAAEISDTDVLDAPSDTEGSFAPRRARTCSCPVAKVFAYWDGADWWCHTCGYELSAGTYQKLAQVQQRGRR
jgi:hypothetical protein